MKAVRIGIVVVVVAALAAFAGVGVPESAKGVGGVADEVENGITVTGSGAVTSVPDRAEVSFGVTSERESARGALAASSAQLARVIAALKQAGVAAEDIQTQSLSLSQRYDDGGATAVGYIAQNSVRALLRDLGRAGAVIDAAVEAGANQVYGPSLLDGDRNELYRAALRAAHEEARAKAEAIASAAGVTLGRVTNVTEASASPAPMEVSRSTDAAASRAVSDAPPVPIEPGADKIEAQLSVTFAIQ